MLSSSVAYYHPSYTKNTSKTTEMLLKSSVWRTKNTGPSLQPT